MITESVFFSFFMRWQDGLIVERIEGPLWREKCFIDDTSQGKQWLLSEVEGLEYDR